MSIESLQQKKAELSSDCHQTITVYVSDDKMHDKMLKDLHEQDMISDELINAHKALIKEKHKLIMTIIGKDDCDLSAIKKDIIDNHSKIIKELEDGYAKVLTPDLTDSVIEDMINKFRQTIDASSSIKQAEDITDKINKEFARRIQIHQATQKELNDAIRDLTEKKNKIPQDMTILRTKEREYVDTMKSCIRQIKLIKQGKIPDDFIDAPFENFTKLSDNDLFSIVDKFYHEDLHEHIKKLMQYGDFPRTVTKMMDMDGFDENVFIKVGGLDYAGAFQRWATVEVIINKLSLDADVGFVGSNGNTVLMRCGDNAHCATLMINKFGKKCNIGALNSDGQTALIRFILCRNHSAAKLLLETFGAECLPNHKDSLGRTVMTWAVQYGRDDIVTLLKKYE